jgi:hypothetical protein
LAFQSILQLLLWKTFAAPKGVVAVSYSTTSGAAPTSPPEGVFRSIRCWKYRQAFGTHYGPTRTHPAELSPRHWRNGKAGTTTLHHLHICRRTKLRLPPSYCKWRLRAGRGCWSTGTTAASAGTAGPFRDYGPGQRSGRHRPPGPQDLSGTTCRGRSSVHHLRFCRGRSTFQGLLAGRRLGRGQTKPEY